MLSFLHVENFAVIEHVELEFGPAFNAITGETGAGKSLLVEALMAVLGERTSPEVIRQGARRAVIEAHFDISSEPAIATLLAESGYQGDDPQRLILRREIGHSGSRAFVNDSPAPLHIVRQLGNLLVDFHGQHEHQSLLNVSLHRALLDSVGHLDAELERYRAAWRELRSLIDAYVQLREHAQRIASERDYYQFLLGQICAIDPQPGEKDALEAELRRIEHSEQLFEATATAYELLYSGDQSVHDLLVRIGGLLEQLSRIDDYFRAAASEVGEIRIRLDELAKDLQRYNTELEFAPDRLQQIRERLQLLAQLERRFGSIEAAIAERQRLERELSRADVAQLELDELRERIYAARRQLGAFAIELSAKRQAVARAVERSIVEILSRLGIPHATFRVAIEQRLVQSAELTDLVADVDGQLYAASEHGIDSVAFFISTNKGEAPAPLHRIISGGEASRVMLALKTILAKSDRLPLLVFDEIDVGISGRIAHRVGVALEELGAYHQVIAITHNPQIAARAHTHIVVEKRVDGERTRVVAYHVSGDDRVEALARLIAGEKVTDAARRTARELLASRTYA